MQIIGDPLTPGPPEVPLQPPSPFLIVANKFLGGEFIISLGLQTSSVEML